jgi:beta-mannosidase
VDAAAVATTPVHLVPMADQADPSVRRETILVAELRRDGALAARSVTTFGPDKQLLLERPSIERTVELDAGDGRAVVRLRSDTLARWVELALGDADVIFDDNYVDLPAGRELTVGFALPEGWTIERAREALTIRSVIDTYA